MKFGYLTDEDKKKHSALLKKHGNTNSTMYKLVTLETVTPAPVSMDILPDLPQWVMTSVFRNWILPDVFIRSGPVNTRQRLFYEEHIAVTPAQAFSICSQTIGQSKCKKWKAQRRKRITASKV